MQYQWDRYQRYCLIADGLGIYLDLSRIQFSEAYIDSMRPAAIGAIGAMAALEAGATANPDENRMVGHYWLRAPQRAPSPELQAGIRKSLTAISLFCDQVGRGIAHGDSGAFRHVIHIGIGGSALGPQLLCESQRNAGGKISVSFLDNCDPDEVGGLIRRLGDGLGRTLVSVVSKSGWTPTPRRVMAELEDAYARRGLVFARHAVATTVAGSALDVQARRERWLARFPLWDWVGGRTSVTSAVGLLPAALHGVDTAAFLRGAARMDELTRAADPRRNPAAMLALMWHWAGGGHGRRNMVVLPYRDRLALLPRYVQQLVMESLGKRLDRAGAVVEQGLTAYGHKGVTDQHAYIQQLREGRDDAFVMFVAADADHDEDLSQARPPSLGDHLFGNLEGMRDALSAAGRDSITITLPDAAPQSIGALIALYERAVGLYAELIDVNAYHQPSVDKDIAAPVLRLQADVLGCLRQAPAPMTAEEVAAAIGQGDRAETVYKVLRRQARLPRARVGAEPAGGPFQDRFSWLASGPAAAARAPAGRDHPRCPLPRLPG
jgi:glucose-6-phosphate isomerase